MAQPIRRPTGPPKPRIPMLLMRVWDTPTRLFHWAIVVLVVTSYVSAQAGWDQLHYWSGYVTLTMLLFRLFLCSPAAAFAHLAKFGDHEPDREIGHNAAGGWMVLLMLAALAVQAGTGLFAGDLKDGTGGPFMHQVAEPTQRWLTTIHHLNFNVILALIALHIVAILAYAAVKRHDLVRAMVTGRKRLPANMRQPAFASPVLAG